MESSGEEEFWAASGTILHNVLEAGNGCCFEGEEGGGEGGDCVLVEVTAVEVPLRALSSVVAALLLGENGVVNLRLVLGVY